MTVQTPTASVGVLSCQSTAANLWSARRIAAWLADVPTELFFQPSLGGFANLAGLLHHIAQIEANWLHSLQGLPYAFDYYGRYEGTVPDLLHAYTESAQALDSYVQSLRDEDLLVPCAFMLPLRWPDFERFERPRYEIVQHVFAHSTYHRGQVVSAARALGLPNPPPADFIFWTVSQ